jgi:hypothetical protein
MWTVLELPHLEIRSWATVYLILSHTVVEVTELWWVSQKKRQLTFLV